MSYPPNRRKNCIRYMLCSSSDIDWMHSKRLGILRAVRAYLLQIRGRSPDGPADLPAPRMQPSRMRLNVSTVILDTGSCNSALPWTREAE